MSVEATRQEHSSIGSDWFLRLASGKDAVLGEITDGRHRSGTVAALVCFRPVRQHISCFRVSEYVMFTFSFLRYVSFRSGRSHV